MVASVASREDSLMMMSRYSFRCSWVRSSCLSSSAKPLIETIGVLNSWEKLSTKSERSISMPPSSSAIRLKLFASSVNALEPERFSRAEKSPAARRFVASMTRRTGFSGNRLITNETTVPTGTLINKRRIIENIGSFFESLTRLTALKRINRMPRMKMMMEEMINMANTIAENNSGRATRCRKFFSGQLMFFSPPYSQARERRRAQIPDSSQSAFAGD